MNSIEYVNCFRSKETALMNIFPNENQKSFKRLFENLKICLCNLTLQGFSLFDACVDYIFNSRPKVECQSYCIEKFISSNFHIGSEHVYYTTIKSQRFFKVNS